VTHTSLRLTPDACRPSPTSRFVVVHLGGIDYGDSRAATPASTTARAGAPRASPRFPSPTAGIFGALGLDEDHGGFPWYPSLRGATSRRSNLAASHAFMARDCFASLAMTRADQLSHFGACGGLTTPTVRALELCRSPPISASPSLKIEDRQVLGQPPGVGAARGSR